MTKQGPIRIMITRAFISVFRELFLCTPYLSDKALYFFRAYICFYLFCFRSCVHSLLSTCSTQVFRDSFHPGYISQVKFQQQKTTKVVMQNFFKKISSRSVKLH